MRDVVAAKRYAEAFFAFAKETIGSEKSFEELGSLTRVMAAEEEFKKFLENTEIPDSDKFDVIEKVFGEDLSREIKEFLKLLINKKRVTEIDYIADYVKILYYRERKVEKVFLSAARPLEENIISEIKTRLENKFQKKLELEVAIEPDLIAGIRAKIGNMVIDGSVKRKLQELKENLMETRIN
ncbi:MAG: ATP synthase F1 subunit delta [Candidatus Omnitrophota bacterium]